VLHVAGKIIVIDDKTYILVNSRIQNIGTSKIAFDFKSSTLLVNEYLPTSKTEVVTVPDKLIGNFHALHDDDKYIEPNEIIYDTRFISIPNAPDLGFRLDFIVISVKKALGAEKGYTWRTSCMIEKTTHNGNNDGGECVNNGG